MANDFPKTTVIHTMAPPATPTFGDTVREVVFTAFLIVCGVILFGSCGVAWWLW